MSQKLEIEKQMKRGILEYAVLMIISEKSVYAGELLDSLKNAGLITVEGTIYPLLSRLRSDEYIDYTWVESNSGPPRKYYTLTGKGEDYLEDYSNVWEEMVHTINQLK